MSRRLAITWALVALATVLPATAAEATSTIPPFTMQVLGADGQPDSHAGSHPDRLIQEFEIQQDGEEDLRELTIAFPPGLSGNAKATPYCRRVDIEEDLNGFGKGCPPDTQVGVLSVGEGEEAPIYNLPPGPNEAVAFVAATPLPTLLSGKLRPGDQSLSLRVMRLDPFKALGVEFNDFAVELWGVPADHQEGGEPIPRKALLTSPTRCGGSLTSTIEARTWQNPETTVTGTADTGLPLTGCNELPFDPSLGFELGHPAADSPTGARIAIAMPPEATDPSAPAQSQIEGLRLDFPPGMTVSLGAAATVGVCTDAQLGLGTEAEPACPPSSKVGRVEFKVGSLQKPLQGAIYLGGERPGDRFRLFIVASGSGSTIKFVGSLRVNPATGRLSADLQGLPQASFEELALHLDGGPGALLATPLGCGATTATATLTPYSGGPTASREAKVTLAPTAAGPCAKPPFAPSFEGGSTDDRAGRPTTFTTTVRRADGEGLPSRVEVPLPAGMSAALGGVPLCSQAAAAAAACPAASRIGGAVAQIGPGGTPAAVSGGIFLTGAYRQAPFGLAIAFPAKVGPFDLGEITVRAALEVDPHSGRVSVLTDPLPTSVEGIPVRFREIGLDLDRPGFLHNPTNCSARALSASFTSTEGAKASASTPFAITGCVDLPFKPRFSLALQGRSELHAGGRPGLLIAAKVPSGGANLRSAKITLPKLARFTGKGALELCARSAAEEGRCGKKSRIGTAVGHTPSLSKPMKGYVYSVQPKGKGSPDLLVDLHGSGVEVELHGATATVHGHALTTLEGIPDFPLSSFAMNLSGGKHGALTLAGNPCGQRLRAPLQLVGQNAAELRPETAVAVPCGRHG